MTKIDKWLELLGWLELYMTAWFYGLIWICTLSLVKVSYEVIDMDSREVFRVGPFSVKKVDE